MNDNDKVTIAGIVALVIMVLAIVIFSTQSSWTTKSQYLLNLQKECRDRQGIVITSYSDVYCISK